MPASKDFWDKRAKRYDAKLCKGPNYAARLERAAVVFKDTDNVLDVGCPSGEITLDLTPQSTQAPLRMTVTIGIHGSYAIGVLQFLALFLPLYRVFRVIYPEPATFMKSRRVVAG